MHDSIVHRLDSVALRAPQAAALKWHDVAWTYGGLGEAIAAAAALISARIPGPGARVGLLLRNSPQYVALYYGALAAGAVAVPLNAQERATVLTRQLEHCGASLLVGDPAHPEWPQLTAAFAQTVQSGVVPVKLQTGETALAQFLADVQTAAPRKSSVQPRSADLATLIYTSGTTGRPKGVMLSHGNLLANNEAIIRYLDLTPADRGLCVLPFHFSYGNSVLHSHLLAGAQLSIEDNFAFPRVTLQRIQDEAITGFAGVPSTFALLLGRCQLQEFDLRQLRYITQAGGAMPRPLIERLRQEAPGTRIFIMYGQTEATARLSYLPPEQLEARLGSVGLPIPGVQLDVRRDGRSLPPGEIGEICARGPNVMMGYWNDADASAEVLRAGWLHTGDLGHRDQDGYFFIDGRAVEMIKVGAFRVSPQEVEEVIAQLGGVEEVAVAAIPDELLGQSIKAVIVPRAGVDLDIRAVKAHCRQQLAAYKVPKVVQLASTLPRTASGKVQRFKLA